MRKMLSPCCEAPVVVDVPVKARLHVLTNGKVGAELFTTLAGFRLQTMGADPSPDEAYCSECLVLVPAVEIADGAWPRPRIKTKCGACQVDDFDIERNMVIVSPGGCAHFGRENGVTDCNKDATGPEWWWPG